jgi:hypothetical protein
MQYATGSSTDMPLPPQGLRAGAGAQTPPFPPCRPAPPGAARGGPGGGWVEDPRACDRSCSRTSPPSAPFAKKSRFQDAKPTLLHIQVTYPGPHKLWVNQVLPVGSPSYQLPEHGCCSLSQVWPTECRLVAPSFGGFDRSHLANASPTCRRGHSCGWPQRATHLRAKGFSFWGRRIAGWACRSTDSWMSSFGVCTTANKACRICWWSYQN